MAASGDHNAFLYILDGVHHLLDIAKDLDLNEIADAHQAIASGCSSLVHYDIVSNTAQQILSLKKLTQARSKLRSIYPGCTWLDGVIEKWLSVLPGSAPYSASNAVSHSVNSEKVPLFTLAAAVSLGRLGSLSTGLRQSQWCQA